MTDQTKDENSTEPGSEELEHEETTEVPVASESSNQSPPTPPAPPSPPPAPTAGAGSSAQPPYEPAPRRLTRRPEGKIIAGVCSGLGAYTGVDPVIWRIGLVVLVLAGGAGVLAYIVAWLVMPMARPGEPMPEPALAADSSQVGRWVGIGLLAIGALLLFRGFWHFRGGVFWGLVLLGLGIAIWGRDLVGPPRPPRPRPSTLPPNSPPPMAETGTSPTVPMASPPTTPPPPTPPPTRSAASSVPRPSPAVRARRESSVLGRLVVGASALAIGLGLLLDNLNVLKMTPRGTFAVLLAIVGLGLFIGTWFGSARWLIIPGILLVPALAITTFIPLHVRGGFGEVTWSPESRSELRGSYELFAGKAVLDLSKVNFGSHDRSVEVDVTFGELLVVVPDDQPVEIDSKVQGGEMTLFGQRNEGWDVENGIERSGDKDLGTLAVDAEVVFGKITVRRVRSTDDFETGRNNDRNFRFGDVDSGDAESFDFRPLELDRGGVR